MDFIYFSDDYCFYIYVKVLVVVGFIEE